MRRIALTFTAALVGGCASILPQSEGQVTSSDDLSPVIAAAIFADLEHRIALPQFDTTRWYWHPQDLTGIPSDAIARQLLQLIQQSYPGTADSLAATRSRSLRVSETRLFRDSALVMAVFGVGWREPCQWNGSATGYDYRFRRTDDSWLYVGKEAVLWADPLPPPAPGRPCRA
jgi:hypothetical protein